MLKLLHMTKCNITVVQISLSEEWGVCSFLTAHQQKRLFSAIQGLYDG